MGTSPEFTRPRRAPCQTLFFSSSLSTLVHRIAAFAFAFGMAIPRCQWRHRCVVTLGKFLVVLCSKPLWRKENWGAKAERRCARCKKLSRAMLKNREEHHSDDAVKKGYEVRCAILQEPLHDRPFFRGAQTMKCKL